MSSTIYPISHGLNLVVDDSDSNPRRVYFEFDKGEIDLTNLVIFDEDDIVIEGLVLEEKPIR